MNDHFLKHSAASKQWQQIGTKPHHGIDLALFSLHSAHSCGIGEYLDLIPVIDWISSLGFHIIQLLPLNDTGFDSSPYNAISAFALNPLNISLKELPYLRDYPNLIEEFRALPKFAHDVKIDYPKVREIKTHFLRRYYEQVKEHLPHNQAYQEFKQKSAVWLPGYALFKALKIANQGISWEFWPEDIRTFSPDLLQKLNHTYQEEVEWHSFQQFLCDQQFHAVKEHANSRGVLLKGDIPILIARDSADVWQSPQFFRLEYSAGAPPDMFSKEGQNWGFPIYNWEELEKQGYQWWIDRLKFASRYYHLYRLDHIVGFYRIWAIPVGKLGKDGHFIPEDPQTWILHGEKIMQMMLNACDMLPIGEDLGIVPPPVRKNLKELGICGTKVMRWERYWEENEAYIPVEDYPVESMTTVSTHDSETLQLWWQDNLEDAQVYAKFKGWYYTPKLSRDHHYEILWDSHHSGSLFHINLLQEYLALVPGLTWSNLEDERINFPGTHSNKNWSYRFRPSVEELVSNSTLKHLLQEIIL